MVCVIYVCTWHFRNAIYYNILCTVLTRLSNFILTVNMVNVFTIGCLESLQEFMTVWQKKNEDKLAPSKGVCSGPNLNYWEKSPIELYHLLRSHTLQRAHNHSLMLCIVKSEHITYNRGNMRTVQNALHAKATIGIPELQKLKACKFLDLAAGQTEIKNN